MFNPISIFCLLTVFIMAYSCGSDDNTPEPEPPIGEEPDPDPNPPMESTDQFLLLLRPPTQPDGDVTNTHVTNNIEEGSLSIVDSQESVVRQGFYGRYVGGAFFTSENTPGRTTKYAISEDGIVTNEGSLPFNDTNQWRLMEPISGDRLLTYHFYFNLETTDSLDYSIIDPESFTEVTGKFKAPEVTADTFYASRIVEFEGKFYFSYYEHNGNYGGDNMARMAVYDAATFDFEKLITDDRTGALGYENKPNTAIENGNLYVASSNTAAWGGNENLPAGILKINSGESDFDPNYFFNVSDQVGGNHILTMTGVGNGKALTKVFRNDLIVEFNDYFSGFVVEHYLLDLEAQTAEKLDMPLTSGHDDAFAAIGEGKFALNANTENGNFIYIFDSSDESVTQGLEYIGAQGIDNFIPLFDN